MAEKDLIRLVQRYMLNVGPHGPLCSLGRSISPDCTCGYQELFDAMYPADQHSGKAE